MSAKGKKEVKKPVAKKTVAKAAEKTKASKLAGRKRVTLTVRAEPGKEVYLAGCFNGWDPKGKKMTEKDGVYAATVSLAPGSYQYKFVIDGVWTADPENLDFVQNDCGTLNSVLNVN